MSKNIGIGVTAVLALLSVENVRAEDEGVYVGAGIGISFESSIDIETASKVFVGYAFNKYVSIELAYVQVDGSTETLGTTSNDTSMHGVSLAGLGRLPVGKSSELFGKLGVAQFDQRTATGSVSNSALNYGVGFTHTFGKSFALGVEFDGISDDSVSFATAFLRGAYKF
jgi:hypothetical protein